MERPYAREEAHAARVAISTADPYDHLASSIVFPSLPSRVLDVGAGGSDVTAKLLGKGYEAYAVDPRYAVSGLVERKVRDSFHALDPSNPLYIYRDAFARQQENSLKLFNQSMRENPGNYLPASATALPFRDNTFDLVFSVNAITEYHSMNELMLLDSVDECLRVTKIGGTVELFPVKVIVTKREETDELALTILLTRQQNFRKLLKKLERTGTDYGLFKEDERHSKLTIYKD